MFLWFPVICLFSSPHRDQCVGRHGHLFNSRSHGSHLQKVYWRSGEGRSYYIFLETTASYNNLAWCFLCRVRPVIAYPEALTHLPIMVKTIFMLLIIGVDSQFTLIGEAHLSLLVTSLPPRLTLPLLLCRSDHHLHL